MELSRAAAKSWVSVGKYSEAMPAAQLSLRCAIDIYSPDVVELVPAYLLLAEASIGEPTHTNLILILQSAILQCATELCSPT